MVKYLKLFNRVYCFMDYWVKWVWLKFFYLKYYYFLMIGGWNCVIFEMEFYGCLYFCGFWLIVVEEFEGKLYFVVKKEGELDYN